MFQIFTLSNKNTQHDDLTRLTNAIERANSYWQVDKDHLGIVYFNFVLNMLFTCVENEHSF